MCHIKQFGIIMLISFCGEILNLLIPVPIPASIYGLVLMLFALIMGWVPLDKVEETGSFLIDIMPVIFIPAAVGLLNSWADLKEIWIQLLFVTAVTTVLVMIVSGKAAQWMIRRKEKK